MGSSGDGPSLGESADNTTERKLTWCACHPAGREGLASLGGVKYSLSTGNRGVFFHTFFRNPTTYHLPKHLLFAHFPVMMENRHSFGRIHHKEDVMDTIQGGSQLSGGGKEVKAEAVRQ